MDAAGKGFLSLRLTNSMESQTGSSHLKIPLQVSYHAEYLRSAIACDKAIAWRFMHESAGRWYANSYGRSPTGGGDNDPGSRLRRH
jgi:hypothetical protein